MKSLVCFLFLVLSTTAMAGNQMEHLLAEKVSLEKIFETLLIKGSSPDSIEVREVQTRIDNLSEEILAEQSVRESSTKASVSASSQANNS